jgi:hypothetical protein
LRILRDVAAGEQASLGWSGEPHHRRQRLPQINIYGYLGEPGITLSTGADDFAPLKQMQLEKFNGTTWEPFGGVLSGVGN